MRSTRSLRLTGDGERYLEYARSSISTLEAGKNAVARSKTEISGTLSVSIPSDLGRQVLLPWLDAFQEQHPRVGFQVRISDRLADLYRQPVDLAVRYGTPTDSGLVACVGRAQPPRGLRLARLLRAPRHAAGAGGPAPPKLPLLRAGRNPARSLDVPARRRLHADRAGQGDRVGDDGELVRRWALGARAWPTNRATTCCRTCAGRPVEALGDYASEPSPLYLLCVHRMLLSPAVRRLREFLQERFRQFEAG